MLRPLSEVSEGAVPPRLEILQLYVYRTQDFSEDSLLANLLTVEMFPFFREVIIPTKIDFIDAMKDGYLQGEFDR